MATRSEIIDAIQATDQRLSALAPAIAAAPERPLRQGSWTVRDTMCHIAARADGVSVALSAVDQPPSTAEMPAALEIDEINRRQIVERTGRGVTELLNEAAEGHRSALARLATLDEALLNREIQLPYLAPGSTVADLILLAGPGHEQAHLDTIAEALTPAAEA